MKSHHITPEGLGCKITHLPPCLQGDCPETCCLGHLHNIHSYVHQHLKLVSDWMKTRYNRLAKCAGYNWVMTCDSIGPPAQKKISQVSIPMGGPIQGSHADKRCGVQDPVEPSI
jgi:hypothetical protein